MYVVELIKCNGSVKHSQLYEDRQLQNGISINVSDCPPGNYVLRLVRKPGGFGKQNRNPEGGGLVKIHTGKKNKS
jgi:hypothetical protein